MTELELLEKYCRTADERDLLKKNKKIAVKACVLRQKELIRRGFTGQEEEYQFVRQVLDSLCEGDARIIPMTSGEKTSP